MAALAIAAWPGRWRGGESHELEGYYAFTLIFARVRRVPPRRTSMATRLDDSARIFTALQTAGQAIRGKKTTSVFVSIRRPTEN
jgi:hypothetical protein